MGRISPFHRSIARPTPSLLLEGKGMRTKCKQDAKQMQTENLGYLAE